MRNRVIAAACGVLAASIALGCGGASDDAIAVDGASHGELVGGAAQFLPTDGQVCLTIQRGTSGEVADATIREASPRWADPSYPTVSTGSSSGSPARAVLRFDLSQVPLGATITSATFSIYQLYKSSGGTVDVHRLTQAWSEPTATWTLLGSALDPTPAASFSFPANSFGYRSADVRDLVQDWIGLAEENEGIALDEVTPAGSTNYRSSEAANVGQRPKLELCYVTCDDGVQNGDETGVDCGGPCASCVPAAPAGLVAHLAAEGDALDSTGTVTSTVYGGVTFVPGRRGQAFHFNGTNGYIHVATNTAFWPATMTLALWAKSDNATWNDYGWHFAQRNNSLVLLHPWVGERRVTGVLGSAPQLSFSPIDITTWHHYAMSYDGAQLRLFVDGAEVATANAANAWFGGGALNAAIGKDDYSGRYGRGAIDEVMIFNRALSAGEIHDLFAMDP